MKDFYELNILNFESIKSEIDYMLNSDNENYKTNVSYITPRHKFEELPNLQNMIEELGLHKYKIRYLTVIVNPGEQLHPHIDGMEDSSMYVWNLLLPIKNTEHTTLSFYESDFKPQWIDVINEQGHHVPYWYIDPETCKEVSKINLSRPTFINSTRIHGVMNHTNIQRQTISIHVGGDFNPARDISERFLVDV
jgi:hypothetical protein